MAKSDELNKFFDHPKLDFLPESFIALNREVSLYHKHLFQKYDNLGQLWGTPESVGILAAEVMIALNDTYDDKQFDFICEKILERLIARRTANLLGRPTIILPPRFNDPS